MAADIQTPATKLDLLRARRIALRRRWWFLAPLFLFGIAGGLLPRWLPARYRSQALILVQQQQVPTQYVAPNVTTTAADRLQSMTQQILSRTRLQHLIDTLGLYPAERTHTTMDALVDRMAKEITTTTVTAPDRPDELSGFRIAYTASSPVLAQRVVNQLTSLFIEDNLKARTQQSEGITGFLQNQLHDAQQTLAAADDKLRVYKVQHLGQLPEQVQGNLAILQNLNLQYNAAVDEVQRAKQDKTYFESLQKQYQDQQASGRIATPIDPNSPEARLKALELRLADLQSSHNDAYPDVIHTKDEIAGLKKQIAAAPVSETAATADNGGPIGMEAASRLKAIDLEIAAKQKQADDTQRRIQEVQDELNRTPLSEQELAGLIQAEADAQKNYQSLLQKDQESKLATDLEENQQGERFQVVDPASLPIRPVSPNPLLCLIGGWLLGLAAGAGLVVLREITDATVNGEAAVGMLTLAPILVSIPVLVAEARGRRWRTRGLEWTAAGVLLVAAVVTGWGGF